MILLMFAPHLKTEIVFFYFISPVGSTTASPNDLYLSTATLSLQSPQIIASFFDRSYAWHKRLYREIGYL